MSFTVLDMNCCCHSCERCIEDRWDELREQQNEIEEMEEAEKVLIAEFPEFQDATCTAIVESVCDEHDSEYEGLRKRRRIMEDAQPLAEAWESAEYLKKIFRKGELPRHFEAVCRFLG